MMYSSSQPLTIEEIAQHAPSAVAIQPHQSRSSRYTYIPTAEVIKGMQNGYSAAEIKEYGEYIDLLAKAAKRFAAEAKKGAAK